MGRDLNGNADVGSLQRGGVVDTVARHAAPVPDLFGTSDETKRDETKLFMFLQ